MKKGWPNSRDDHVNGLTKPPPQNYHQKDGFDGSQNTLQWIPLNDQNKPDQSRSMGYGEITNYDREQVYNWYHTVPLRHDGYPENVNQKDPIQDHINKKGRLLNERQKRYRTSFTMFQLNRLEEEFQKDMYAIGMKRMRLAGELNLTEKQVKVWFQNRRMKYKRICQRLYNRRMAGNKNWE